MRVSSLAGYKWRRARHPAPKAGIIKPLEARHPDLAFGLKASPWQTPFEKYRDYVMTGFLKSVKDAQKALALAEAEAVRGACLPKGMSIGVGGVCGSVVRFQPPLAITRQQMDQALAILTEALQEAVRPAHAIA